MAKIFEALDKTGLTEQLFQGMDDTNVPSAAVPGPTASVGSQPNNAASSAHVFKAVSLHVPGMSPVLPFEQSGQASEQYRILRTKIVQHLRQPRVLIVSSPSAGDGKSITALNLAGALALKGAANVLLIDGDFRRPSIWRNLGLEESPGLANILAGTASLEESILRAEQFGTLHILRAGKSEHNPTELLDSQVFNTTFARLKQIFKYIVIDSPPIASVADYDLLTAAADGVILVVRPDHTSRLACNKAIETIPKEKFLGVVMNRVTEWFLNKSYGYAPYYYY